MDKHAVKGAVLSQTARADTHVKQLAEQYGISVGKAALIEQLIKQKMKHGVQHGNIN